MLSSARKIVPTALLVFASLSLASHGAHAEERKVAVPSDGVVRVKSAYTLNETIARVRRDIADKGIRFFLTVDQAKLAADAGVQLRPSTLLIFGNPPLGTLFIRAKPEAGLDWPVRLLVQEDDHGQVWLAYTDFIWIAQRHGIPESDRQPFKTASGVIASIASSVTVQ